MQFKLSALTTLALAGFAAATAVRRTGTPTTPASQCNTADLKCCNSTQESDSLTGPVTALLGLLGVNVGSITALVGLTCSPLTIIGGGGSSWLVKSRALIRSSTPTDEIFLSTAQPVCCANNTFSALNIYLRLNLPFI